MPQLTRFPQLLCVQMLPSQCLKNGGLRRVEAGSWPKWVNGDPTYTMYTYCITMALTTKWYYYGMNLEGFLPRSSSMVGCIPIFMDSLSWMHACLHIFTRYTHSFIDRKMVTKNSNRHEKNALAIPKYPQQLGFYLYPPLLGSNVASKKMFGHGSKHQPITMDTQNHYGYWPASYQMEWSSKGQPILLVKNTH